MEQRTIISEARATGFLPRERVENLKSRSLADGPTVVFEDTDKRKLVAQVVNGVVAAWQAFDGDGAEVSTVVIRQPSDDGSVADQSDSDTQRIKVLEKVCACFPEGDRCWWVEY